MTLERENQSESPLQKAAKTVNIAKSYVNAMSRLGKEPHPYLAEMATMSLDDAADFQPGDELLAKIHDYEESQRAALIKGVGITAVNTTEWIGE